MIGFNGVGRHLVALGLFFMVALFGPMVVRAQTHGPEGIHVPGCDGGLYACGGKANTVAIERCYDVCAREADRLMNRVYANGMRTLSPEAAEKLRQSERAWIVDRDNWMKFIDLKNGTSGSIDVVLYAQSKAQFVRTRLWLLVEGFRQLSDPSTGIPEWMLRE